MLSHVIPQRLVTNRIPIKLQLPGKSRLIFEIYIVIPGILERLSMTFTANGKNNSDFAHFLFST